MVIVISTGVFIKENISNELTAMVFPNPCISKVTISIPEKIELKNCVLDISNQLGCKLHSENIMERNITIGMQSYPEGIYFYQVLKNNAIICSGKIVILSSQP